MAEYEFSPMHRILLISHSAFLVLSKSTRNTCDVGALSEIGVRTILCSVRHFESTRHQWYELFRSDQTGSISQSRVGSLTCLRDQTRSLIAVSQKQMGNVPTYVRPGPESAEPV